MTIKEVSETLNITQDTLRYYEKIGLIPSIKRTKGKIRDYQKKDVEWIEHVTCMRKAGLSIKTIIDYYELLKKGDSTIIDRLKLLEKQKKEILEHRKQIDETLKRINYKIERYEIAVKTGKLTWE